MKKIKSLILATLALAIVAPVFTACSDDDDKTVNNLVSEYEVNEHGHLITYNQKDKGDSPGDKAGAKSLLRFLPLFHNAFV